MNAHAANADRIKSLAGKVLNGAACDDDFVELDALLRREESSRRLYADYCQLHVALRLELRAERGTQRLVQQFNADSVVQDMPAPSIAQPALTLDDLAVLPSVTSGAALQHSLSYFTSGWPVAYMIAMAILGIGLIIGAVTHVSTPGQVAVRRPRGSEKPSFLEPDADIVGRITGVVACKWAEPQMQTFSGAQVSLGRKYTLTSGLMEIAYDTGAKVILQGPVTYEVDSSTGGYLAVGRLTARLEAEVRGLRSESANQKSEITNHKSFTVRTPTTSVTDLGTEFGVEVDDQGGTTSHVFRGSVRIEPLPTDGHASPTGRVLHANESARVQRQRDKDGVHNALTASPPATGGLPFVRELPVLRIRSFDLVDVVAGGNGFSGKRGLGIDPTTGQRSRHAPSVFIPPLAGDYRYHLAETSPYVDGVFIPDGGSGPVQVDSAGHKFDGFDKTDNLTYGHLWAGGPIGLENAADAIRSMMPGVGDLTSRRHGVLLTHANAGITFDLATIRRTTGGKLLRFRGVACNLATYAETDEVKARFWVLVDGRQRFVSGERAGNGIPISITAPLREGDGFLTLAVTDGGDGSGWDWTAWGDPRVELESTVAPASGNRVSIENKSGDRR